MVEIFLTYWILSGFIVLLKMFIFCKADENFTEKMDDFIRECSQDYEISEEWCIVIVGILAFLFGFIILPIALVNKISNRERKGK